MNLLPTDFVIFSNSTSFTTVSNAGFVNGGCLGSSPCPLETIWVKYCFRLSKYFYSRQEIYENKYITKSNWIPYINKTRGLKVDPRYSQVTKFSPYWTNFDQIIGYFAFLESTFLKGLFLRQIHFLKTLKNPIWLKILRGVYP